MPISRHCETYQVHSRRTVAASGGFMALLFRTLKERSCVHGVSRCSKEINSVNRNLPRRRFLQTGAVAAGALGAAKSILLEPVALAQTSKPVAASERVRFGMIGIGMQGPGRVGPSSRAPGTRMR